MAKTFSGSAKAEMCRAVPQKRCCALAECFGILLFCNTFSGDQIRIVTESQEFGQLLPKLFRRAFGFGFDRLPEPDSTGKQTFLIYDAGKIGSILEAYGFNAQGAVVLHVNLPVIEEECCRVSFLRGAFLAGGSVTDPAKGYHMELVTTHQSVARETEALMGEVLGFYPKSIRRAGGSVLYFKKNEQIADVLTCMGAPVAGMGIIEARLEKELNNKVNRRCNCDDANTSKVVDAAQEQLGAIRALRESGEFAHLPQKLQQAAIAREEYPEYNLTELAAMMEPPISKPAMSHRLQKLVQRAREGTA